MSPTKRIFLNVAAIYGRSCIVALLCATANAASVVIEAESFREKGGWVVDQQFMDQMGSPYLLAHGLGNPVEDAVLLYTNSVFSGPVRLYVRTRDWVSPQGPGRFCVKVNGVEGRELGKGVGDWGWVDAGEITLKQGENEIRLHDHTGFEGRVDALAFLDADPGEPLDTILRVAKRPAVMTTNHYDFVVVGGGYAGMCAAVAAARRGVRTALVQDRPVFGGNASSEVRVGPIGKLGLSPYRRNSDLAFELWEITKGDGTQMSAGVRPCPDDRRIRRWLEAEPNLTLFPSVRVTSADKTGSRIESVAGCHIESGARLCFLAEQFADCTGDGWLAHYAGADLRVAPERAEETGEKLAVRRDGQTGRYGSTNFWLTRWTTNDVTFPSCPWALQVDERDRQMAGNNTNLAGSYPFASAWNWESGMDRDVIRDGEFIRDYNFRAAYGMWDYLKNRAPDKARFAKAELSWMGYILGKRAARRIMGDYTLTEQDLTEHRVYDDGVVTTTWYLDMHFPDPRNAARFRDGAFLSTAYDVPGVHGVVTNMIGRLTPIRPYPIPFRCFYSRNVDNLWMAGKDISCTFVAMSSVRVENTTAQMGQMVGLSASLCLERNCTPRQLGQDHFADLKAVLDNPWPETRLARQGRYLYQGRTSCWQHVRWYLRVVYHWLKKLLGRSYLPELVD